jgi:NTP pyrophosphatase (non-canonical NTP hydrolase)
MEDVTLNRAQQIVDEWINKNGVRYFNELTNMTLLMEEVGELARVVARKYGEQSFKDGENPDSLSEEMADILFVLICLANQTGIDLTQAFFLNIDKKTKRDINRHHQNPKLL